MTGVQDTQELDNAIAKLKDAVAKSPDMKKLATLDEQSIKQLVNTALRSKDELQQELQKRGMDKDTQILYLLPAILLIINLGEWKIVTESLK